MSFSITTNKLEISEVSSKEIEKGFKKVVRLLPNLNDLMIFKLNLKLHRRNLYRVRLILTLPKEVLVVRVESAILGQVIRMGFDKLINQIKVYKEKHFKGLSKYPNQKSIRKVNENEWMEILGI